MSFIIKEGYPIIKIALGIAAASYVLGRYFHVSVLVILSGLALLFAVFSCFFFRNPERKITALDNEIVSPADGKILEITTEQNEMLGVEVTVIRIFLSIFNVHVQRAPIAGTISDVRYTKGKFLPAMNSRAHIENEQNAVIITSSDGKKVMCKQIAGLIARRIVMWKEKEDVVKQGELYSMIKFGSQVDIYLPKETEILVKAKQKVKAGTTILAEWQIN